LYREIGSYIPLTGEEVLDVREGYVMNDYKALHLRARNNYTDFYGHERKAGEEWLITKEHVDIHI
jgi:hypothetical protein